MADTRAASSAPGPYGSTGPALLRPVVAAAEALARRARRRRYAWYRQVMQPLPGLEIVDIGAGDAWGLGSLDPSAHVTSVDRRDPIGSRRPPHQSFVKADAAALPFPDDAFDIAYSNSVVEHIPPARREAFAHETRRVARHYWVQTPNRRFWLEPHALLPCVQFLPPALRRKAWRLSPRQIAYEESLELLGERELRSLFPDALILRERVGPLTKSLVAVGPAELFDARTPNSPVVRRAGGGNQPSSPTTAA